MRELETLLHKEEISYSRMVEMINEKAAEPQQQFAVGFVTCDLCLHEWVAVRPAQTDVLECPNCLNMGPFTTPEDV